MSEKILNKKSVPYLFGAGICFLVYILLGILERSAPKPIVYPALHLSDSIFEYQNMIYKEIEGYDEQISLSTIPYLLDVPKGPRVTVGNASIIKKNGFYFLIGEVTDKDLLEGYLKHGLTNVVDTTGDVLKTNISLILSDTGYLNGCEITESVWEVLTEHGERMALFVMKLAINGQIYETDKQIVVGCMSQNVSTEGYEALQHLTEQMVFTLRADEKRQKAMER